MIAIELVYDTYAKYKQFKPSSGYVCLILLSNVVMLLMGVFISYIWTNSLEGPIIGYILGLFICTVSTSIESTFIDNIIDDITDKLSRIHTMMENEAN